MIKFLLVCTLVIVERNCCIILLLPKFFYNLHIVFIVWSRIFQWFAHLFFVVDHKILILQKFYFGQSIMCPRHFTDFGFHGNVVVRRDVYETMITLYVKLTNHTKAKQTQKLKKNNPSRFFN